MSVAVKALIGISVPGVIGLVTTSYVLYTENKQNKSEIREPQFAGYDNIKQGYYKKLFKEVSDLDSSKVYGCAIMKMENSQDNKNLNFKSEISIRKGNKGWVLNTRIINTKQESNGKRYLDYVLTSLTNESNKWKYSSNSKGGESYVFVYDIQNNTEMDIRVPNDQKKWFNSSLNPENNNSPNYSIIKEYRGAWISDSSGSDDWIFKNMYSVQSNNKLWFDENFSSASNEFKSGEITYSEVEDGFDNLVGYASSKTVDNDQKIIELLNEIKSSKGTWTKLDEVCNPSDTRKLNFFCEDGDSDLDLSKSDMKSS